mgnify:CR=1 FL=1
MAHACTRAFPSVCFRGGAFAREPIECVITCPMHIRIRQGARVEVEDAKSVHGALDTHDLRNFHGRYHGNIGGGDPRGNVTARVPRAPNELGALEDVAGVARA